MVLFFRQIAPLAFSLTPASLALSVWVFKNRLDNEPPGLTCMLIAAEHLDTSLLTSSDSITNQMINSEIMRC